MMKKYNYLLSMVSLLTMFTVSCTDADSDKLEDLACVGSDLVVRIEVENDGSLRAVGIGGAAPYSFVWGNGSLDPIVLNPSEGEYTIEVKDANGCARTDKITISAESHVADGTIVGSIKDVEGNTYQTIKIGTQIWTQKNLNVSRYRNGDIIPEVKDPEAWINLTTGAWCYYENNTANGPRVGKLYNWYAVTDSRGLAPEGYHVPSVREWDVLINHLGGRTNSAEKLKSTQNWPNPQYRGTNESGFTAIPSGVRHTHDVSSAQFHFGEDVFFWTSTDAYEDAPISVWGSGNYLRSSHRNVSAVTLPKTYGMSLRVVKD